MVDVQHPEEVTQGSPSTPKSEADTKELLQPLRRNQSYLFLISAQAVSNLGDWLYILALIVLVGVHWHASPGLIAVTMLCLSTPMIVLGPFTGILADKFNRTTLMMASNITMAILVALIPSVHKLWVLFVILIAIGSFEAVFSPAEQGKLKEVVPDSQMHQATATNTAIGQFAKVLGPGLSGLLVAVSGAMSAFYLDSASFVISTVLLFFTIRRKAIISPDTTAKAINIAAANDSAYASTAATIDQAQTPDGQHAHASQATSDQAQVKDESFLLRFREGLSHIVSHRFLFVGLIFLTVILLTIQLTDSQFITLLRLKPHFSANLFGYLMASAGGGTLIAALILGRLPTKSPILTMCLGTLALAIGYGGIALAVLWTLPWLLIPVLAFAAGLGAGCVFIPFQTAAQRTTPVHLTGRVFGVIGSFTTGASLLGPVAGGIVVTIYGAINGFLITGGALVVIGVTTLLAKRWLEPRDTIGTESNGGLQEETASGDY